MENPERSQLPPCSCGECPDHQPGACRREAIVKARDGSLFCGECLMARMQAKRESNYVRSNRSSRPSSCE
jgi:hypothetical protein